MESMETFIGKERYQYFWQLKEWIEENYTLQQTWSEQKVKTKKWNYELKYRKGSKTFCAFYFTSQCVGFMIILGKEERLKVEAIKSQLSSEFVHLYEETPVYHDGKWFLLELDDFNFLEDLKVLLTIKRKPDRKN